MTIECSTCGGQGGWGWHECETVCPGCQGQGTFSVPPSGGKVLGLLYRFDGFRPAADVSVSLDSCEDDYRNFSQAARTGPDGRFMIDEVRPGRYFIRARGPNNYETLTALGNEVIVRVETDQVVNLTL